LIDKKLNFIIDDRTSGASVIESHLYELFEQAIKFYQDRSRKYFTISIPRIKKRFSMMANILNLTAVVEKFTDKYDPETVLKLLIAYKDDIENNRKLTVASVATKICRYSSIFTLSNSSAVFRAILTAKGRGWNGEVRIAESRPKNEGVLLASKLAKAGIRTILGVDATVPDMVKNSGAIFLGADAVTQTYFVNKIGSDIAMEYGMKYRKPVFVGADRGKFISNRIYRFVPDDNPSNEITSRKMRNLAILNNYFEKITPRGKVRYICGDGIISASEVKNLLKRGP